MKKILGVMAVALFVGAPVFAQSTITYQLQLAGTPGSATVPYDSSAAVTSGTYAMPAHTTVLNWAAAVTVSGTHGGVDVGGAANLVFDLKLHQGASIADPLVGPTYGLGSPTTGGFYSTVQNGDPGFPVQPAAFPWVFDVYEDSFFLGQDDFPAPPYGRLIDPSGASNGPGMVQYTFPSTYSYYHANNGTEYTTTAAVLAASGTLMGMGAGYPNFDFFDGAAERAGVGLTGVPMNECFQDIGNRPMFEGQINMTGLPTGTYTLELVPSATGNNVLAMDMIINGCATASGGTSGAFAVAADAVVPSAISFTYVSDIVLNGSLVVNLAPAEAVTAGCMWSVDGGAAQLSGAQVDNLTAGTHVVSFIPASGWSAPANLNVEIAAGLTTTVPADGATTFVKDPELLPAVASVRMHNGVPYGIPFVGMSVTNPGGVTTTSVECRNGAVQQVVLPFAAAVTAVDGTINAGDEITVTGGTINTLDLSTPGMILVNMTTTGASTGGVCVKITMHNIASVAGGNAMPDTTVAIAVVRGDVNGSGDTGPGDINAVKAVSGASDLTVNANQFRRDLNLDSSVGPGDINLAKASSGFVVACP